MGIGFTYFASWLAGLAALNIWGFLIKRRFTWFGFILAPFTSLYITMTGYAIYYMVLKMLAGYFTLLQLPFVIIIIPMLGFSIILIIAMFHEAVVNDEPKY